MTNFVELLVLRGQGASLKEGEGGLVTFLNPYSYLIARKNFELFEKFDVLYCDGVVLATLMGFVGKKQVRKSFDMTSLASSVFLGAIERGDDVFFVGSEPGVAEEAVRHISRMFPALKVSGVRHGFFSSVTEQQNFIEVLIGLAPKVVVVGMGTPAQERFLVRLHEAGWQGLGYTCGGFLHQTARSGMKYYPDFFNRYNLRWLYRIIDEPKLIKRYAFDYPRFLFHFFFDCVRRMR